MKNLLFSLRDTFSASGKRGPSLFELRLSLPNRPSPNPADEKHSSHRYDDQLQIRHESYVLALTQIAFELGGEKNRAIVGFPVRLF